MLRRCLSVFVATILLITGLSLSPATSAAASRPIPPDLACRHGKVALTFDDGPHKINTPRLLKVLRKQRAQATFFVTGQNAQRHPALLRQMVRDGHAVEVHSWDHPDLTSRPNRSVKRQLHLTKQAIRRAIRQSPTFYRPPYGATDKRVRKIARRYGLREVLWTVDTADWRNRSAKQITRSALAGLRRHRENNILMHDAVGNSPRTIKAVPAIIKGARKKGYCIVPLEQMMALGTVTAGPQTFTEDADSAVVRVTFRLDGPAQRNGSFRVHSQDGTAVAGVDYRPVHHRVLVRRGDRTATVAMRVLGDPAPNLDKQLTLRLDGARRLKIGTPQVVITIRDDGTWSQGVTELFSPMFGRTAGEKYPKVLS